MGALPLLVASLLTQASARVETTPIASGPTAANDTAVWLHPTTLSKSLVFGTDQLGGGLISYGLDGTVRQALNLGLTLAVDVRYAIDVGGAPSDVVLAVSTDGNFRLFSPDPDGGALTPLDNGATVTGNLASSAALYNSPQAGASLAVFVADAIGTVRQYKVNVANGKLVPALVRTVVMPGRVEGMAVDDLNRNLFLTVASKGLFVLDAEQGGSATPEWIDSLDAGRLQGVAGVAVYLLPDAGGYVIASASQASRYAVYGLSSGYPYLTSFTLVPDGGLKGATGSRGIDVTPLNLGAPFSKGMFVAHDPNNAGGPNYKLAAWDDIAGLATPPLTVDGRLDPRTWKLLDAGAADAGAKDAGTLPICPAPVDAGATDGGDAGLVDAGPAIDAGPCRMPGTGGGGGTTAGVGGGYPPLGGGPQEPMGCGCGNAGLLVPLAGLVWALLRRRRSSVS